MDLIKIYHKDFHLILTIDEILIINNALNEVCHALTLPDFSVRMGADRPEVLDLLTQINSLIKNMKF